MTRSPEQICTALRENVGRVIIGNENAITLLLVALICEGHVLIEDVPGLGKTLLAKTLSRSLALEFRRVQCTPDLLPSDITGVSIFNLKKSEFEYRKGPAFTNILLADEINRATPRTQSALLECMEERQITVDGETRLLPTPFLVMATQNPIEQEGTFPLPEAQLDRFMIRLELGYPDARNEQALLTRFAQANPFDRLAPVATAMDLAQLKDETQKVHMGQAVAEYLVNIVQQTRLHKELRLGASPRASLALMRAARALALLEGRTFVLPDDIKRLVKVVLCHRLIIKSQARLRGQTAAEILSQVLEGVPVPVIPGQ